MKRNREKMEELGFSIPARRGKREGEWHTESGGGCQGDPAAVHIGVQAAHSAGG